MCLLALRSTRPVTMALVTNWLCASAKTVSSGNQWLHELVMLLRQWLPGPSHFVIELPLWNA